MNFREYLIESKTLPKPWPKKYKYSIDIAYKCKVLNETDDAVSFLVKTAKQFNDLKKKGDLELVAYSPEYGSKKCIMFIDKKNKSYWWTMDKYEEVMELAKETFKME